jgi:hypothetical protein
MAEPLLTLGQVGPAIDRLSAQIIDGEMSHRDAVAIIDKSTGLISTIQAVTVERHEEGGRTIWIEVEEM